MTVDRRRDRGAAVTAPVVTTRVVTAPAVPSAQRTKPVIGPVRPPREPRADRSGVRP